MTKSGILLLVALGFLVLGIFSSNLFVEPITEDELALQVSKSLQREVLKAQREAKVLLDDPNPERLSWTKLNYSFFLLDSARVIAWSKNSFLPESYSLLNSSQFSLLRVARGDFITRKWPLDNGRYLILVLPLIEQYSIENQYVKPQWNNRIFATPSKIHDLNSASGSLVCVEGDICLFKVSRDLETESSSHYLGFILILCSIFALIGALVVMIRHYHHQRRYELTFLIMAVSFTLTRIAMVKFNFPGAFVTFSLFDPKQFASSSFNASIADLFLNALVVLLLCLYLFLYYPHFGIVKSIIGNSNRYSRVLFAMVFSFLCFISFLFPYLFFETIYHNSSISLGITEGIAFSITRFTAFASVIIGCVSAVAVGHASFRLLLHVMGGSRVKTAMYILVGAVLFLAFFMISGRNYWITLLVAGSFLLVTVLTSYFDKLTTLSFNSFLYFVLLSVALSIQGALSIQRFNTERRVQDQFKYGNNFLIDKDVLGEYLMNESAGRIARDPFIQSRLANPFISKSSIRQRIRQLYMNTYFDRYDVKIYLFNSVGAPYENESPVDFATSILSFQNESFKTSYQGIYFINNPSSDVTKQYLVVIPVERSGIRTGYIVLELNLKKVIPLNVFPELLADNRFSQYLSNRNFNYAFYGSGRLASSFGEFNYERDFDKRLLGEPTVYKEGVLANNYFHVAIEGEDGSVAVISAREYPFFFVLTNFSFLFIASLALLLLILLFIGVRAWFKGLRLNYATRIQLYIYLAFFLPLVAVSLTTLSLISRSAREQINGEYLSKATVMASKIAASLSISQDSIDESEFKNELIATSKLANYDVSVYGINGHLIASSQQIIFERQFMAPLINREVLEKVIVNGDNSTVTQESIGKLIYNSSYAAIKSPESGKTIGIISIPFFESAASLEKTQINVLANILTVFVAIFLFFSILSFFAIKWLVFPLSLITRTLRKISFTGKNELITWKSNDEMGMLANEYNRMVENLEQSRRELARSQKESAWREIAKQVAHEIKNPLTPMKLTLQQMELQLRRDELTPDRTGKSIKSLLTQLEILNDIAASFSSFARMPAPEMTEIELNSLLRRVVELYADYKTGKVEWRPSPQALKILGDEQLLMRIFSNVILNALQSGAENEAVSVQVVLTEQDGKAVVVISDDGQGIPHEMIDKIFVPNFTTKKSGSGLGLAVVRQGVEQIGGSIEVQSEVDKGTKFTIRFDIA